MDTLGTLGREFQSSYIEGSGYNLSQTLSPIAPSLNPKRLIQVYRSVNHQTPEQDIRKQIVIEKHPTVRIHKEESDAWVTVYQSYWRAIGEILKAEAANGTNMKVYNHFCSPGRGLSD